LRRLGYDVNADGKIDVADSRALTKAAAIEIYKREYWDVLNLDSVLHQAVATRLFDICVNAGPTTAVEILRLAIRACTTKNHDDVSSKATLISAANEIPEAEILPALRSEQAGHYRVLVAKNPDKYGRYLNGWLNRAYSSETFVG
jgi:lysozyme family protein